MSPELKRLVDEAMKLPPAARAALAGTLIESLDVEVDDGAEDAWRAEIARRAEELDSGKAKPIPWSKARRMIDGTADDAASS